MKIAIGGDHATVMLKKTIVDMLTAEGHKVEDFGTFTSEAVDYPDYGLKVAQAVASGEYERGIAICGTGIGISISANKVKGIRCALCTDVFSAKATRLHNDTNVLALGERNTGVGVALEIVRAWVDTPYSGDERHNIRVGKIMEIEDKYFK
jgi:ribose 5-phosphate isomerase B